MRALVGLLLIACGCGRFGFSSGDPAADANADDDAAGDAAADGDAVEPPHTIRIQVKEPVLDVPIPIADAYIFANDGNQDIAARTDASGFAEITVAGPATVHVAWVPQFGGYQVYSYVGIAPGTALFVGPQVQLTAGANQAVLPINPTYPGAEVYISSTSAQCSGSTTANPAPVAMFSVLSPCQGRAIPAVVRATTASYSTLAVMIDPDIVLGTSTSVDDVWRTPVTHELEIPTIPGYAFTQASASHTLGPDDVFISTGAGSAAGNTYTFDTIDETVDLVGLSYGSGGNSITVQVPVPPAVGIRTTVPSDRMTRAVASMQRVGSTMSWTYTSGVGVRQGSVVVLEEAYGVTSHYYFLDPSTTSVARPRLPAPLDGLHDGANTSVATMFLAQLGDQTFAEAVGRSDEMVRNFRYLYAHRDYAIAHRTAD